jgi:hypothetical protein
MDFKTLEGPTSYVGLNVMTETFYKNEKEEGGERVALSDSSCG